MQLSFLLSLLACNHDSKDTGSVADTDADTDADSDSDTDADSDTDTDADSDADSDTDSDADSDTDSDADSDTDTDTDTDADIPWIDAGTPDVAPPDIDWLADGQPAIDFPSRACPDGWTADALPEGGHVCDPWPTGVREDCDTETSVDLPGSAGCAEVGSACPSGEWPSDVGDTGTWFVVSGGSGDGSRSDPFGTIADALAVASSGDTIAIGKGTFDEALVIDVDVTLRGLCPTKTMLTLSTPTDEESGVVNIADAKVTLKDLQVGDTAAVGVVASGGELSLDGVVVNGAANHGVAANGTAVSVHDVLVENIAPRDSDTANGDGLYVLNGSLVAEGLGVHETYRTAIWDEYSSLDLSDLVVWSIHSEMLAGTRGSALRHSSDLPASVKRIAADDLQSYALGAVSSGNLTVEDAWVVDIAADNTGSGFGAIGTQGPGGISVSGAYISNVVAIGLRASSVDGTAVADTTFEDVVVDNTNGGAGINVSTSTALTIARAVVRNNFQGVVLLFGDSSAVSDLVVEDSEGPAVYSYGSTGMTFDRVLVDGAQGYGFSLAYEGEYTMTDVAIRNVLGLPDYGWIGTGVSLDQASLVASRVHIDAVDGAGVWAHLPTGLSVEDLDVANITGAGGAGEPLYVSGWDNPPISVTRAALTGGHTAGIDLRFVDATLEDVSVSGIDFDADGRYGYGLWARYSNVSLTNAAVSDVGYGGVVASTGIVTLTDVAVSNVAAQDCVVDTCAKDTAASGVVIQTDPMTDGAATFDRVLVDGAHGVGVQVDNAIVTASNVVVRNNGVGVDVAGDGAFVSHGFTAEANTVDRGAGDEAEPGLLWGTVVENSVPAGTGRLPLKMGYFLQEHGGVSKNTCGYLLSSYNQDLVLTAQGTNEFTMFGSYASDPDACVWDGKALACTGAVASYLIEENATVTDTSVLSVIPESLNVAVVGALHTIDCSGKGCAQAESDYAVTFPCSGQVDSHIIHL